MRNFILRVPRVPRTFSQRKFQRVGVIFFPDTDAETSWRSWGTHPPPPHTPRKDSIFNYSAKIQIYGAKTQIYGDKFKYIAPKLKYVAPKFKYSTPNSNTWNSVPPKTSRFVRGKLPAPPDWHPPTPPSVLVKNWNAHPLESSFLGPS